MYYHFKVKILSLLLLISMFIISVSIVFAQSESKPIVVTSTTVLSSIVRDLAGDRVSVIAIVSPSVCPAHYDIKPSDVIVFRRAKLILYHGFEPWIKQLKEVSGTQAPLVKISGPWNTPSNLKRLYEKVAKVLSERLGLNVNSSLNKALKAIDEVALRLKSIAEEYDFSSVKVIVMKWQKPFIVWLGFNVVKDYPPPERISTKDMIELERLGREYKVQLVIDNLQSGVWFGEELARRIGAVHVVLTNFPGTLTGLNNVTKVMEYNVEQLVKAIENYKTLSQIARLEEQITLYKYIIIALIVVAVLELVLIIALRVSRK
ncbi:MAG TPA: zinc ABC transporter substrate-binding protein [Desulfurococcales archaeon]|nr:zinc ABC transporter substrate-binding protein [Desulfurococcales archaeon]